MIRYDSDNETNDSNSEHLENPELQNKISNLSKITHQLQQQIKSAAFQKISQNFILNHPENTYFHLQRAQKQMSDGNLRKSYNYAMQALLSSKNYSRVNYQKALIILIKTKIYLCDLTQMNQLIKQADSLKQVHFHKQILILKAKVYSSLNNFDMTILCLMQLENRYFKNQLCSQEEQFQIIVFYAETLIKMGMDEEAQLKLNKWLDQFVQKTGQFSNGLAKIYCLLAQIQRKKGNLAIQISNLSCAQATLLRKLNNHEQKNLVLQIKCLKIQNFLNRKNFQSAVQEIQQILKLLPDLMHLNYQNLKVLQNLAFKIYSKVQMTTAPGKWRVSDTQLQNLLNLGKSNQRNDLTYLSQIYL